jgi:hypothetical protein
LGATEELSAQPITVEGRDQISSTTTTSRIVSIKLEFAEHKLDLSFLYDDGNKQPDLSGYKHFADDNASVKTKQD